ncbi:hypothetical protein AQUCO_03700093v1 [Aquilegia coerulea]|uniref:Thionin-like protein n=1 Tax=Aquilegia coerulea TaxID=218851 RepID=A0A2G5CTF6_AQUCA|nr:hypothetical protein AQUCO_03700093v1 [Aquilegia coerulea]
MKKIAVIMVLLFLLSSHIETVKPDASDCLDACQTGCVAQYIRNPRKRQQCDAACVIKCRPSVLGGD